VGPRAVLDTVVKRKILSPRRELNPEVAGTYSTHGSDENPYKILVGTLERRRNETS
jgi:hypothetical protein